MWYDWFWVSGGSGDRVFGVSIYGDHHGKWWHRWFIKPVYRALHKSYRAKMWVYYRLHPAHRYHLVNTGLEPGYYDVDTLMLHASFALLERYVVAEMGGPEKIEAYVKSLRTDWDPNAPAELQSAQADREDEALALYRWWTVEKPADEARRDELLHRIYGKPWITTDVEGMPGYKQIMFPERDAEEEALRVEFRALEKRIEDDEQKMLHRLIDIRKSLWT